MMRNAPPPLASNDLLDCAPGQLRILWFEFPHAAIGERNLSYGEFTLCARFAREETVIRSPKATRKIACVSGREVTILKRSLRHDSIFGTLRFDAPKPELHNANSRPVAELVTPAVISGFESVSSRRRLQEFRLNCCNVVFTRLGSNQARGSDQPSDYGNEFRKSHRLKSKKQSNV